MTKGKLIRKIQIPQTRRLYGYLNVDLHTMIVPLQLSVKEKGDYICPPIFSAWFHVEIQFLYLQKW